MIGWAHRAATRQGSRSTPASSTRGKPPDRVASACWCTAVGMPRPSGWRRLATRACSLGAADVVVVSGGQRGAGLGSPFMASQNALGVVEKRSGARRPGAFRARLHRAVGGLLVAAAGAAASTCPSRWRPPGHTMTGHERSTRLKERLAAVVLAEVDEEVPLNRSASAAGVVWRPSSSRSASAPPQPTREQNLTNTAASHSARAGAEEPARGHAAQRRERTTASVVRSEARPQSHVASPCHIGKNSSDETTFTVAARRRSGAPAGTRRARPKTAPRRKPREAAIGSSNSAMATWRRRTATPCRSERAPRRARVRNRAQTGRSGARPARRRARARAQALRRALPQCGHAVGEAQGGRRSGSPMRQMASTASSSSGLPQQVDGDLAQRRSIASVTRAPPQGRRCWAPAHERAPLAGGPDAASGERALSR